MIKIPLLFVNILHSQETFSNSLKTEMKIIIHNSMSFNVQLNTTGLDKPQTSFNLIVFSEINTNRLLSGNH